VSDETFAELKKHLSEREILELTVAVATENFYNRLNAPLEIESQGFCAVPVGKPQHTA
jgi:alkylhydroperoxidase family enzyme